MGHATSWGRAHSPRPLQVHTLAPDASGQWLASGSADGTMRLWEVATARCVRVWELGGTVSSVAWCPDPALHILSAVSGSTAVLLWSGAPPAAPQLPRVTVQ